MSEALYWLMGIIAKIHNYIMHLNDKFEYNFSDKALHFLVIGAIGMIMIFVVYPLFKWLAQKNHIMVIAWIYVFTLILVITFAVEIGQKITGTGNMEFDDIVFGVLGFFAMFAAFAVIRGIYHGVRWLVKCRITADAAVGESYNDAAVGESDKENKEDKEYIAYKEHTEENDDKTVYDTIKRGTDSSDNV